VAVSGLCVAGVLAASDAAGHTATSPTTTRAGTTSTALPLLRASDLPAKYTEVAQPVSTTSTSPRYPTVDANCVVNPQVPFSGLVPETALITWATDRTGVTGGAETTYTFSDVTTAKALYKNFADTYTALTKCPSAKQPVPAAGNTPARTIDLGKWANLAIPHVGDEQTGAVLTPPTGANTSRVAVWRDGETVVVLNLRDYAQPKGVFNKLVVTAEKRVQSS
jgi:hypothetical protein